MPTRDLALTLTASILIGAFLIPSLVNTQNFDLIPHPYVVLFLAFPSLALIGMFVVKKLSKKLALLWQVAKFALVGVLNTAIDFGILNLLILITTTVVVVVTTWIPPLFGLSPTLWANVAKVFATGFSMVWNFTGYKLVVFKR